MNQIQTVYIRDISKCAGAANPTSQEGVKDLLWSLSGPTSHICVACQAWRRALKSRSSEHLVGTLKQAALQFPDWGSGLLAEEKFENRASLSPLRKDDWLVLFLLKALGVTLGL